MLSAPIEPNTTRMLASTFELPNNVPVPSNSRLIEEEYFSQESLQTTTLDTVDDEYIRNALAQNEDDESLEIDEEELCCRGEEIERVPNSTLIYEELY